MFLVVVLVVLLVSAELEMIYRLKKAHLRSHLKRKMGHLETQMTLRTHLKEMLSRYLRLSISVPQTDLQAGIHEQLVLLAIHLQQLLLCFCCKRQCWALLTLSQPASEMPSMFSCIRCFVRSAWMQPEIHCRLLNLSVCLQNLPV